MKKLISLLLAVMLVMSMMTFNVMASTDTPVVPVNAEDAYEAGTALPTGSVKNNSGYSSEHENDVLVIADTQDSSNKIFEIYGQSTDYYEQATLGLTDGTNNGFYKSAVNKFTAKINLPTVEDADAITSVFVPRQKAWSADTSHDTFGVKLQAGKAYCYNKEISSWTEFYTGMQENTWYRIDAIMDCRETMADKKTYMNAFIYDAEGNFLAESGWHYASSLSSYSATTPSFLGVNIQAYNYDFGKKVLVNEFDAYKVENLPTYTLGTVGLINKYISVGDRTAFRDVGEYFNLSNDENALISETSANKVARIEMDMRYMNTNNFKYFPYDIFGFSSGKGGKGSGTQPFDATAIIADKGLVVRSYNGTKYDTAVTLSNDATNFATSTNTWYRFVWDVDFTNYSTPVAMFYLKDQANNILVQTKEPYAIKPMMFDESGRTIILYCGSTQHSAAQDRTIHMDNTNIYTAASFSDLSDVKKRTVIVEESFDVFNNPLYNVGATDEDGNPIIYNNIAGIHQGLEYVSQYANTSAVIAEENRQLVNGTVLTSTAPIELQYTYSNPVPVSKLTTDNIELYADGNKMTTGYSIIFGTVTNGNTSNFSVKLTGLDWGTDYKLTIKKGLTDYNSGLSGGISAESALYKDLNFSVKSIVPKCTVDGFIFDNSDKVYSETTLTKDDVIKGSVTVTNKEDSDATCYGILAIYDGKKLVAAKKTELITVAGGKTETKTTEEYTAEKDGLTAKLFVWNNFELMTPWRKPILLGE